jgi:hypothetical protein
VSQYVVINFKIKIIIREQAYMDVSNNQYLLKNNQTLFLKFSISLLLVLFLTACDSGSGSGGGGLPPKPDEAEVTRELCSDKKDNDSNGSIDCEDSSCSKTSICSANKVEVADPWGDYWDGVPHVTQTFDVAEKTCADVGARLPTATELYRNQIKANTSALMISDEYKATTKDGSEKLWTTIEAASGVDQFTVNLLAVNPAPASNRIFVDVSAKTNSNEFRCIWPTNEIHKVGFNEDHCNGPADSTRCFGVKANLNMDVEPRAPLDFVGASQECRLEGASIPVVADYAKAIPNGLPNGSANWEYVGNAMSWGNVDTFGMAKVRFDPNRIANWSYDNIAPASGGRTDGLVVNESQRFRCIGLANHRRWLLPSNQTCFNGDCFHYVDGRSHMIADPSDRDPTTYPFAVNRCRALGAELPNMAEFSELVHAGWIGSDQYLWMSDPVIKTVGTTNTLGNAVGKWLDTGTINWIYSRVSGSTILNADMRTPDTNQAYRCVWHGRTGKLPRCASDQAIERTDDSFACINTADGNATNLASPAGVAVFDVRGNAWDTNNRAQADFIVATAKCKELDARLPTANEVYAARGNAPVNAITDPTAPNVDIWALNPSTATGQHTVVKIVTGAVSSQADTTPQFYRCVWEATRGNVLSGRACNGPAGSNCYQDRVDSTGAKSDNDELIADAVDRVAMSMPSARAECQQAGGKLPDLREFSKLTHNGWQNGSDNYLWIDEAMNWNDTATIGYALGKWLNNGTGAWQYDSTVYGSKAVATEQHNFRCVYSTVVR